MNAVSPIIAALPREPFDEAVCQVNAWRGACLQTFARAEMAVSRGLVEASEIDPQSVRLPLMVGPRFDALSDLLSISTRVLQVPEHLVAAIEAFRVHDKLRHALCHGVATVMMERNGRWSVKLVGIRFHRKSAEPFIWLISETETREHLARLQTDGRELSSALGQFRKLLSIAGQSSAGTT